MPLQSVNLHDKKSKFQPTQEEMRTIAEKMKDPQFAQLWADYMKDLQDPKYREEEEAYLRQVEEEAHNGGDQSFDFVFPKAGFLIELLQADGKTFVNMCHSDKIDEYREESTNDRMASHWHVPVSVGKERKENHDDKDVNVFDAVFHPKTLGLADRSDRFMCFLAEIAIENINSGYNKSFGFEFKRHSSPAALGTPANQTVKREKGKPSPFAASEEPVSQGPQKPGSKKEQPPAATATPKAEATKASAPKKVENLPEFSIVHSGEIDLTDAWNWKVSDKRIGIPKNLIVRMKFPGVKSASVLDLEIEGPFVVINKSSSHPFYGSISLPFSVEDIPKAAKFEKTKGTLSLTLNVLPPEAPPKHEDPKSPKEENLEWLEAKGKEEGVRQLQSGMYFKVLRNGSGKVSPNANDSCDVHYAGTLINGKKFDSSYDRGQPATFKPTQVIKGWTEALQLMKEGDKWEVYIPYNLAYGEHGRPPTIPAFATLVFEMELVVVKGGGKTAAEADAMLRDAVVGEDASTVEEKVEAAPVEPVAQVAAPTTSPKKETITEKSEVEEELPTPQEVPVAEEEKSQAKPTEETPTDRYKLMMQQVEKARKEREAAEEAERQKEKDAAAARAAEQKAVEEAAPKSSPEEESAPKKKEDVEVIDLRAKQQEWLNNVKKEADAKEQEAQRQTEELEEVSKSINALIDPVLREEEEQRDAEMKRKLKEARRKAEQEKEMERLDTLMREKQAELPLTSKLIFEIE